MIRVQRAFKCDLDEMAVLSCCLSLMLSFSGIIVCHTIGNKIMADATQTCKTSADARNSAFFDIFRVILEILPNPRRNHFYYIGEWGPRALKLQNVQQKRKIYILGYKAKFELKHIISRTKSIIKHYLFKLNDV